MENIPIIYSKLEAFIKKFYSNELLRGSIFFIGFGLLYLIFTLFIEYFLWLKPTARAVLFVLFIGIEFLLLSRYIIFPIFKLFKFSKGIDYTDASKIIGNHFSEVGDKLTNFLQLSNDENKSELLIASIDQKAKSLQPIPFASAINFRSNRKFLPLAFIPILFFLFFFLTGKSDILSQSFHRVVNFKQQFLPPAPFEFSILNRNLQTEQNKDFVLKVTTKGQFIPQDVKIYIGKESYFMESSKSGEFQFIISKPTKNIDFHLEANSVSSRYFELNVITIPSILNFGMTLNFPTYLNKKTEVINGTGNAILPEGTLVTWKMSTLATQKVTFVQSDYIVSFVAQHNIFLLSKKVSQNTDYQIVTSNNNIQNYEKLDYQIAVIKDQFPTISVSTAPDSLEVEKNFVLGQISDDYGLSKLQIVYYPKDKPNEVKRGLIAIKSDIYDRFVFKFPSNLSVTAGVSYDYYFQIFDNDAPHGYKSSKSSIFSHRENTEAEKVETNLQQQNDNLKSISRSLQTQTKQLSEMDKLQQMGKEKENLDFKDQKKVEEFVSRQEKQDEIMKQFTEKLKDNLDKVKSDKVDEKKELLTDRLQKTQEDIEKNKKLLQELNKLNEKLAKEELFDKMDKFKQTAKNQTKSLQQLVELTKRFYVEKKVEQLASKLQELSEKQAKLADNQKENSFEKQIEINKEFDKIQQDLHSLQKENQELKKPLDIPETNNMEKSIENDLSKASDELKKETKSAAKPKQKSAAKKMKEMGEDMKSQMDDRDKEQMDEDVVALRQILDNLIAYSFTQEDVMKKFKSLKRGAPAFNKNLKLQQDLKQQFKHIDDSLFSMSLRNPKFEENITKEIGNVQYNVDKAIQTLADANVSKGVSYQQFAESASNRLADFLADILTNMQTSLSMKSSGKGKGTPSPGKGSGSSDQLPDIIQKQEALSEKAKKAMQNGSKPGEDKEGQGKEGQGKEGQGKPGGKDGKDGKDGKGSKVGSGSSGGDGQGGNDGNKNQNNENNAMQIMQIYKEQQQLRDALQNELIKQGLGGQGQNVIDQMKQLEKQLINKGFTNDIFQKMLNLKYELLKLDKAVQQQGEDKKRQSQTNKKEFNNNSNALPVRLQDYINSIEILNRQALPLQPYFNQKVQKYFKKND